MMNTNKLQLSIWAENLTVGSADSGITDSSILPDPFAVVTILHKEKDAWPTVLDQTEVMYQTSSPDWTKLFPMEYTLGKPLHICVSIYNANVSGARGGAGKANVPRFMGSAVFEMGTLLGCSNGGMQARQVRGGGIVVAHVESRPVMDPGSIHFQLRCMLAVPPSNHHGCFFELQRLRTSANTGARAWDVVYRSTPVPIRNNENPTWPEAHLDLFALTGSGGGSDAGNGTKFRLAVYDYETSGNHAFMGDMQLSVHDLVKAAGDSEKALILKKNGNKTGRIVVCMAHVIKPMQDGEQDPIGPLVNNARALDLSSQEEPDIAVAGAGETFEADAADMAMIDPNFANYMAGGCEINAIIAI
jgi:hypothetical protein